MDMPEPITEQMVTIYWERSLNDLRKIKQHIIIDFGKTDWLPGDAADKCLCVARTIRKEFGVKLKGIAD